MYSFGGEWRVILGRLTFSVDMLLMRLLGAWMCCVSSIVWELCPIAMRSELLMGRLSMFIRLPL
jgi:hypothetical protein